MKNLFNISDIEKSRILRLHESATKKQYLPEQVVTNHDSKYDYKKEGDNFFYKTKNSEKWIKASGNALNAIKNKVYNIRAIDVNNVSSNTTTNLPFKNKEEGDKFRKWMNKYYPKTSKKLQLDSSGSYNNSYIKRAWNHKGPDGIKGDIYTEKVLSKGGNNTSPKKKSSKIGKIFVSDTINPSFSSKIDFGNLKTSDSTERICRPNDEECGQFVNDFSDKFKSVGNAWMAYRNDSLLGPTIYSKFKGLNESQRKTAIDLWLKIHKNGGGKEKGKYMSEVKSFVNQLVPSKGSNIKLKIDDIVGIFYPSSSHHEEAFYQGGEAWFINKNGKMVPGKTISRGDAWGMNTHIGIVGAIKDDVPLIFHNIGGNVISDPPSNLRIAWVKRKGGTKPIQVEHPVIKSTLEDLIKNRTTISEQPDSVMDRRLGIPSPPKSLPKKFQCLTNELSIASEYALSQGVNPFFIKYALGILGRESDFGKVMGKYGVKVVPEYVMNKMSEIIPGFKDVLQWGAKKAFDKDNWVPSMGVAQMTPDIAKKYNVNLEDLMSVSGSLVATSKYLIDLYKQTSKFYDTNKPSKIIYNKKLIDNPSSSGNAALDAAIMSYNLGSSKFKKQYCSTNNPNFMAPCNSKNGIFLPYPNDKPNLKLKVNSGDVIKNYVPNIKTDTTGFVDKGLNKYMRDIPKNTTYISSLGYLKEVVEYANKFSCVK